MDGTGALKRRAGWGGGGTDAQTYRSFCNGLRFGIRLEEPPRQSYASGRQRSPFGRATHRPIDRS